MAVAGKCTIQWSALAGDTGYGRNRWSSRTWRNWGGGVGSVRAPETKPGWRAMSGVHKGALRSQSPPRLFHRRHVCCAAARVVGQSTSINACNPKCGLYTCGDHCAGWCGHEAVETPASGLSSSSSHSPTSVHMGSARSATTVQRRSEWKMKKQCGEGQSEDVVKPCLWLERLTSTCTLRSCRGETKLGTVRRGIAFASGIGAGIGIGIGIWEEPFGEGGLRARRQRSRRESWKQELLRIAAASERSTAGYRWMAEENGCGSRSWRAQAIHKGDGTRQDSVEDKPLILLPISSEEDFEAALAEGQESKRPIVIEWMAQWCRKCIYLKPKLEKLALEYSRYKFYVVDVNSVPGSLVKRSGVTKMPTIQLWRNGEKRAEVSGGSEAWVVIDKVKEMINKR